MPSLVEMLQMQVKVGAIQFLTESEQGWFNGGLLSESLSPPLYTASNIHDFLLLFHWKRPTRNQLWISHPTFSCQKTHGFDNFWAMNDSAKSPLHVCPHRSKSLQSFDWTWSTNQTMRNSGCSTGGKPHPVSTSLSGHSVQIIKIMFCNAESVVWQLC